MWVSMSIHYSIAEYEGIKDHRTIIANSFRTPILHLYTTIWNNTMWRSVSIQYDIYQIMRTSRYRPPHHDDQFLKNINTTLCTKIRTNPVWWSMSIQYDIYQSMRTSGCRPPHHHGGLGELSDVIIPSVILRYGGGQSSTGAGVIPPAPAVPHRTVSAVPVVVPVPGGEWHVVVMPGWVWWRL